MEKAWKFLSLFREGAYFKVRRFIQMKIQNFGIAFSEVTVNNLLSFWYIVIHILELLVIFYMISFFFTITIMLWYILAWVLGMLLSCYWDFFFMFCWRIKHVLQGCDINCNSRQKLRKQFNARICKKVKPCLLLIIVYITN